MSSDKLIPVEPVPTVELLTRAADLARDAASAATDGPWKVALTDRIESAELVEDVVDGVTWRWHPFVADCDSGMEDEPDPDQDVANARLIAASGPDHWRAVEAMLREVLTIHARGLGGDCAECGVNSDHPCRTLHACRGLAEQVLRDLGETT